MLHDLKFQRLELGSHTLKYLGTLVLSLSLILSLQGCFAVAAGGVATGTSIAIDRRTTGTILDDNAIVLKASQALRQNTELWQQSRIHVVAYNNVVLLVGQTPHESFKQAAEEALASIPKIRHVHNELSIAEPISLSTRSTDAWISAKIKAKLLGTKNIRANHLKVITEDRIVYLMGLTQAEEEVIATEIAQSIPEVLKIVQIFERHEPQDSKSSHQNPTNDPNQDLPLYTESSQEPPRYTESSQPLIPEGESG